MNIYYKKVRYFSIVILHHVDERYIDKSAKYREECERA